MSTNNIIKLDSLEKKADESIENLKSENLWLKEEVNLRFSSQEHQTIAYQLGQAQLDLLSGNTTLKGFSQKIFNIYGTSLKRKKNSKGLKLFEKIALLIAEEERKKISQEYNVAPIETHSLKNVTNLITEIKPRIIENEIRTDNIQSIQQLRISSIMDEFTYKSYKDECLIDQLSIHTWQQQLEAFKPDILFIESAWRGFNDEWDRKVATLSDELLGIIDWCNKNDVPTMFWNKEDPIHFQTFISLAKKVDYVFTTDVDCIERYKLFLNHNNIFWLPFAAQTKVNNPIEKYEREDAFCFAGAYYVKYPERTADLNNFVEKFSTHKPFIIYDRNYYKDDVNYKFPEKFQFFIKGNLPYDQIDKAYKGYNYSINLNSIKQSQSMFARRVFEVLASNTVLVSNYSKGVRSVFGDLVVSSDNADIILERLKECFESKIYLDHFRLYALRKVMMEHTYHDRMHYILNKVLKLDLEKLPKVLVVAEITDKHDYRKVVKHFSQQIFENKELVFLDTKKVIRNCNDYSFAKNIEELFELIEKRDIDFIGFFSANDFYGEYYLNDLVLSNKYANSNTAVFGKSKKFKAVSINKIEPVGNNSYEYDCKLDFRSSIVKKDYLLSEKDKFLNLQFEEIYWSKDTLSVDYFNYCKDYYEFKFDQLPKELCQLDIDIGLSFKDYEKIIEKDVSESSDITGKEISSRQISEWFGTPVNKPFDIVYTAKGLEFNSTLESGKHDYFYGKRALELSELGLIAGKNQKIFLDLEPGLNLQMVFKYFDVNKANISHQMLVGLKNDVLKIPENCEYISLGFRLYGSGTTTLKGLKLYHKITDPAFVLSNKQYLVVTNHYPSYDDLYKNGFVHSRVKSYLEEGIKSDVFRVRPNEPVSYHEFEGVDVTTGSLDALNKMIDNNHYKTIMVHFLDEKMWESLSNFATTHKIIVWVHGAEIQAWYRRAFNYDTESQIEKAKQQYTERARFWTQLIQNLPSNLHFVFVSQQFAEEVMSDLGVTIPQNQFSVINNPINTELFKYTPKNIEMRKKILSIRPYASKTYANDLTVKAILELSKESFFNDLEFRLIGNGPLFDETLEPLRSFDNVIIEKRFLTHQQIADIHKAYGIFLCPSRMDTQGVSRDEAMSSGLVPITNSVGAIPEFMEKFDKLLAEPEDYLGLVRVVKDLYKKPEDFKKLSYEVSKSVENRSNFIILEKEMILLL